MLNNRLVWGFAGCVLSISLIVLVLVASTDNNETAKTAEGQQPTTSTLLPAEPATSEVIPMSATTLEFLNIASESEVDPNSNEPAETVATNEPEAPSTNETPDAAAPTGYRTIHKSDYGPFNIDSNPRFTKKSFQGREALVVTHASANPGSIPVVYSNFGHGYKNTGYSDSGGGRRGLLRVKMFCEPGACWDNGGGKTLGMFGGNAASGGKSGGEKSTCGQNLEGGWTQRVTFTKTGGSTAMYTYEENRCELGAKLAHTGNLHGLTRQVQPGLTLPSNQWFQIEMEVVMNDEGQKNGSSSLKITTEDGKEHAVSASGQMWQSKSKEYGVQGVIMNFQLQGGETVTAGSSVGFSDFEFYVEDW